MAPDQLRRAGRRRRHGAGAGDRDGPAGTVPTRGDVDAAAVDLDVAVRHELAGLRARRGRTRPVHDVVEAAVERRRQPLAGPVARRRWGAPLAPRFAFGARTPSRSSSMPSRRDGRSTGRVCP